MKKTTILFAVNWIIILFLLANVFFIYYSVKYDDYMGMFLPGLNVVLIKLDNVTYVQAEYTLKHEYAHYVWDKFMNESLKQEFINMSLKYKYNKSSECYWGHDNLEEEDFADSYRYYYNNFFWRFRNCNDKYEYFKRLEITIRDIDIR